MLFCKRCDPEKNRSFRPGVTFELAAILDERYEKLFFSKIIPQRLFLRQNYLKQTKIRFKKIDVLQMFLLSM